jgi:hypothetical protein
LKQEEINEGNWVDGEEQWVETMWPCILSEYRQNKGRQERSLRRKM